MHMSVMPVARIFLDSTTPQGEHRYEFTIDCGAIYFGAMYDAAGRLAAINQFFYTARTSRDDLDSAAGYNQLIAVDRDDFPAKAYMLTREIQAREWLRFHAVVPRTIDPDYWRHKYLLT